MYEVINAIWTQDFIFLSQNEVASYLILALCLIVFLESSVIFLPLPGDTLVIFGVLLVSNGVIAPHIQYLLLPFISALGTYIAFLQGRWIERSQLYKLFERNIDEKHLSKVHRLLSKFGLLSLIISKFIPFVRVVTPMFMGIHSFNSRHVVILSVVSSFIWYLTLSISSQYLYSYIATPALTSYVFKGIGILMLVLFLTTLTGITYRFILTFRKSKGDSIKIEHDSHKFDNSNQLKNNISNMD